MAKTLTSLELFSVINELKALTNTKVNKIYQPSSRILTFNLFKTGGKKFELRINSGTGMYLTSYSSDNPLTPSGFCLFLRKHINNSTLIDIKQKELERIVEFHFNTKQGLRILICELFSKGNFVLCDGRYKIINCASVQKWKDRTIKSGEIYKYPPPSFNLLKIDYSGFSQHLQNNKNKELVRIIATLGFGKTYAEEICTNLDLDKKTIVSMLKAEEIKTIFSQISKTLKRFRERPEAEVIYKENQPVDATPFPLTIYDKHKTKPAQSFNQALDSLYTHEKIAKIEQKHNKKYDQEKERLERIYETQQKSLEKYQKEYEGNRKIADEVYQNYQTISRIFARIKQAINKGYGWYDIHQVLEREKHENVYEANLVNEIKPESKKIIISLNHQIELDLTKSLEKNAEDYYEKAKNMKSKFEGAREILKKTKNQLEKLNSNKEKAIKELNTKKPKPIKTRKKKWYEKFHWFFTSSGLLAVGGRGATTNDILIKKHLEIEDMVFHADIAGSPFFVLKDARNKATKQDLNEVAKATASYSSAWKHGVGTIDVYQVKPEQVTKEAPSGEYIGKGAFMIRGKKNYFRNTTLGIAVGIDKDSRIIAGPESAIRKHADRYFKIKQGTSKKSNIAKKIAKETKHKDIDEVIRALPTGELKIAT